MTSLSQLRSRKTTVLTAMGDSRDKISNVEEKIRRLEEASSELAKNISELETIKGSIDGLTIDEGSWKGQKEDKFEDNYNEYKDSVKNYVSRTEDAKEAMDDDIKRYEADKATYTTGLTNLQHNLDTLEKQISQAEQE